MPMSPSMHATVCMSLPSVTTILNVLLPIPIFAHHRLRWQVRAQHRLEELVLERAKEHRLRAFNAAPLPPKHHPPRALARLGDLRARQRRLRPQHQQQRLAALPAEHGALLVQRAVAAAAVERTDHVHGVAHARRRRSPLVTQQHVQPRP
eukprot:424633-Pleurochrysis_carterae.AAC.1